MKFFVAVTLLIALNANSVRAQTLRIGHDNRAEVMGIFFRLAGASEFSEGVQLRYNHDIDSAFAPFKGHALFAEIDRQRKQNRLSLSSVTTMAPQFSDVVSFAERSPVDAPGSTLSGAWHGAESGAFLVAARDFARIAPLASFLQNHQPLYDSATASLQRAVSKSRPEWFSKFFGEASNDVFIVSPMLTVAAGNFAADFANGAVRERYAFVGVQADISGRPIVSPEMLATVVHEFAHSFVNHIVDAHSTELRTSGEAVYREVQPAMRAMAYSSSSTMLNESVVRAVVIRYLMANESSDAATSEVKLQQGLGFVWMDELVALLGEYEANRSTYKTFEAFMPRVIAFYATLPPRISKLKTDFELRRPRIVSASIADSAQNVNAALTQIVIHSDKPVDAITKLAGSFGANIPILTGATFDAEHTTLTLGIKMQPDHEYMLPLGPGAFVSRDGYPLQPWSIRFRTAGANPGR